MALLLSGLRGETAPADLMSVVRSLEYSQDPQDQVTLQATEAAMAWFAGDAPVALTRARAALQQAQKAGFAAEGTRWGWPIAADAALALHDLDAVRELLALVEERAAGDVAPVARADSRRVRARLLAAENDPAAAAAFEESTTALRTLGSPWHLAVGLADQADYCVASGDVVIARTLADEARSIATQLGAKPLLQRLELAAAATQ
jgi:hypothetical protein